MLGFKLAQDTLFSSAHNPEGVQRQMLELRRRPGRRRGEEAKDGRNLDESRRFSTA